MLPRRLQLTACAAVAMSGSLMLVAPALAQKIKYPESTRVDHVDTYHGEQVHDPYRWLEEDVRESDRVADWVDAQNEITFDYLASIPERDEIKAILTKLWNYERMSPPSKAGSRSFFSRNNGLQNQDVIFVTERDGTERVLFDPNTWSSDGTKALSQLSVSPDGRYAAYAIAEAGSDWKTWFVRDVNTGEDLSDVVRWSKFSDAEWTPDSRGFFYSRYDAPEEGAFTNINRFQKLYYHRLGTTQNEDVLVYHRPDQPDWGFGASVSSDGRYLIITVSKGTGDDYRILVKDLSEPYGMPVDLIDEFSSEYVFVGNDGPRFYFKTNLDAPRGRVIAIDIHNPDAPEEIIAQSRDTLRTTSIIGNMFVNQYLADAKSVVRLYDMRGRHLRDVELPGIGSAGGFAGKRTDTETYYQFSSFAVPPSVYRYDLLTGESTLVRRAEVAMDTDAYVTRQIFYKSKDGTRVPMFVTHRKDIAMDGSNPTLLYGYGGFNIPLTPFFSVTRAAWLEMGGIYVHANLRGGGEYGEEWHMAGTKLQKQNVFDDFIAAAEYLIDNKFTSPEKLAIQGGSNGGLLVGACLVQRPDLFGACLPAVGVMDMLRFHKFTIGWAWVDDYGSSEDPEEFKALRAYSPYHNLKPGVSYPPTLVTTADTDDRVVPGHSFKFAAAMQYAQSGDAPALIRIETRAGHGAGKPTSKRIAETADLWAFLVKNLEMDLT